MSSMSRPLSTPRLALSFFLLLSCGTKTLGAVNGTSSEKLQSISTGPDFVLGSERVRASFTCGGESSEMVTGFYEFRRNGSRDIEDISRTEELLLLNAHGRNVEAAVVERLNAIWQAGGRGSIIGVRVSCSPDGKRVLWDIRYWRARLVAGGGDGYSSIVIVTDENGREVVPHDGGD